VKENVTAWLVPGSHVVEANKRRRNFDILTDSVCITSTRCSAAVMNDDKVPAEKYAVSTSNRNFEGRQDLVQERLHRLWLPAVTGVLTDPRELL
jgi:3-isopropylmalate/(R)-2-methylmalate dehydratase large subunit